MCGIVALVGKDIDLRAKKMFTDLVRIDTIRGPHSTGVLSVGLDNKVASLKKAVDGTTFTDMKRYDKFLSSNLTPRLLLGHNRWATTGAINDVNAHPFNHGSTHLVHNGSLRLWQDLHMSDTTDVDSEAVCFQVAKTGIIDTVSKLEGAFTLAHYDEKEQEFNLIRNDERPMWIGFIRGLDLTVFASEPAMIQMAVDRSPFTLDSDPTELPEGTLNTYKLTDTKDVGHPYVTEKVKFKPPTIGTYGYGGPPYGKKTGTGRTGTTTVTNSVRDRKTNTELKALGYKMGQEIIGQPVSFAFFPQQISMGPKGTGTTMFRLCSTTDPLKQDLLYMYTSTKEQFTAVSNSLVSLKVSSTTRKHTGGEWVLCPVVTDMKPLSDEDEVLFWDSVDWDGTKDKEDESKDLVAIPINSDVAEEIAAQEIINEVGSFLGDSTESGNLLYVDGELVPVVEFLEATKEGCYSCKDPVYPCDDEDILWEKGKALCLECTNDVKIEAATTRQTMSSVLSNLAKRVGL